MQRASFILAWLLIIFSCPAVFGEAFKISVSMDWKKVAQSGDNAIYKGPGQSEKSVIVQLIPVAAEGSDAFEKIKAQDLTRIRQKFLSQFGLHDYKAYSAETHDLSRSAFKQLLLVKSVYRNARGEDVQMIERQYRLKNQLYVVTYLVRAPTLENFSKISTLMDSFQPLPATTLAGLTSEHSFKKAMAFLQVAFDVAASKAFAQNSELAPALNSSGIQPASPQDSDWIGTILNNYASGRGTLSAAQVSEQIAQKCQAVPVEKRIRIEDMSLMGTAKKSVTGEFNCLAGVMQNGWSIVEGGYEILSGTAKYVFVSSDRAQVNASVATVVSEVYNNPGYAATLAEKVVAGIYTEVKREFGEVLPCLSPAEQTKLVCKIGSNLIPIGALAGFATKAPLAGTKLAIELEKIVKDSGDVVESAGTVRPPPLPRPATEVVGPPKLAPPTEAPVPSVAPEVTSGVSDSATVSREVAGDVHVEEPPVRSETPPTHSNEEEFDRPKKPKKKQKQNSQQNSGIMKGDIEIQTEKRLRKLGIDAHDLKREVLGDNAVIAHYDIYLNKTTEEIELFEKGGKGQGISTNYFIKNGLLYMRTDSGFVRLRQM